VAGAATRKSTLAQNLALAAAALLVSLAGLEAACQGFARLVIFPGFDRDMARPNFFLAASDDPVLAYEMKPGFAHENDGKWLRINRYGLRADSDDLFAGRHKIAMLGDSVTMGAGHGQERTIEALLEGRLRAEGDETVVLNFGVPGYATRELLEFLKRKNELYRVDHVVYLLNPNDFARRDTVTEGGDNGLYRMYARPTWQTPWFLRKAVYRLRKSGLVGWYAWMFAANEERARQDIRAMAATCAAEGAGFSMVLLPSGAAYGGTGYRLAEMYGRLVEFLRGEGIPVLAPIAEFSADPARYFDATDHLHDAGNQRMAELLHGFLAEAGALRVRSSPAPLPVEAPGSTPSRGSTAAAAAASPDADRSSRASRGGPSGAPIR
jgi:lysophospholipase L1-like esterase